MIILRMPPCSSGYSDECRVRRRRNQHDTKLPKAERKLTFARLPVKRRRVGVPEWIPAVS